MSKLSTATLDEQQRQRSRETFIPVVPPPPVIPHDEEIDANVQQIPETIHEWAYNHDVERVQTYETARESAKWLAEHWDTERLRKEPTLPCPLWRRNSEGSRQPFPREKVLMVTPDHPGFRTSRQQAETLMHEHRQRETEIREAQVNHEPTVQFHYTHSLQDATTYYVQGAITAGAVGDWWYPSQPTTTQSFPIPTPPSQYGIFHERIAFSTTSTAAHPQQLDVTIPCYYMQGGNWSGPHTITMPGEVMWSVATTSTPTNIFSPPQEGNVNVVYARNGGWNTHQQEQELGDSPECNFVRMVQRHEIELAYINSKRLLKTWLRPDEYYSLVKFGYMIVSSKLYPNMDYWIHDDDCVFVDAFDGSERVAERYCIHSTESQLQKYDKILAKILLLKADEAEFLRRAIPHGGDRLEVVR